MLADTIHETARAYYFAGDYGTALPLWERALAMTRVQGNRPLQAQVLRNMGRLHDRQGAARAWIGIGAVRDLMGDFRRALEAFEEARPALEETRESAF